MLSLSREWRGRDNHSLNGVLFRTQVMILAFVSPKRSKSSHSHIFNGPTSSSNRYSSAPKRLRRDYTRSHQLVLMACSACLFTCLRQVLVWSHNIASFFFVDISGGEKHSLFPSSFNTYCSKTFIQALPSWCLRNGHESKQELWS